MGNNSGGVVGGDQNGLMVDESLAENVRRAKSQYWQTRNGSDFFIQAADDQLNPVNGLLNDIIHPIFSENCAENGRVLDLGCGHGSASLYLAKSGYDVYAMDISQRLLEALVDRKGDQCLSVCRGDAFSLPFKAGEFDAVVSRQLVMQFVDWKLLIREMKRVVRKGGRIIFHFFSTENGPPVEGGGATDIGSNYGRFHAEATAEQIQGVCDDLDLRLKNIIPISFFFGNRIFERALGEQRVRDVEAEMREFLREPSVRQFFLWFDKNVVQHLPPEMARQNVVVLEN